MQQILFFFSSILPTINQILFFFPSILLTIQPILFFFSASILLTLSIFILSLSTMLFLCYLGGFAIPLIIYIWFRRRRLPPGYMGWPIVGETSKLYTENPNTFFSTRQTRYGDVFKTRILGCPCVMISNPESARKVLVSQAHLFTPKYPTSKERLIGPQALFFQQGDYHSSLKRLVQANFLPMAIKQSIPELEVMVKRLLSDWELSYTTNTTINALQEMKKLAFDVAIHTVLGNEISTVVVRKIKHLYQTLEQGYNSMPFDIPGTSFHKSMEARRMLNVKLKEMIHERRDTETVHDHGGGLLGTMLRAKEGQASNNNTRRDSIISELTDTQIADNMIGVIFAARDTTASTLTWILKYLHDNPTVTESVMEEQDSIGKLRIEQGNRGLVWEDTKNMPLTSRVIQETLRNASILSFTFREAAEDVEFDGYMIPKGWKVLPVFRSIHKSAELYPQPDKFDPSRFEVAPRPNTYMPFGNGVHSCPGSELAKLEMLIFLHHLTINYRWKVIEGQGEGIQYSPFPVPKEGFPIRVTKRH